MGSIDVLFDKIVAYAINYISQNKKLKFWIRVISLISPQVLAKYTLPLLIWNFIKYILYPFHLLFLLNSPLTQNRRGSFILFICYFYSTLLSLKIGGN